MNRVFFGGGGESDAVHAPAFEGVDAQGAPGDRDGVADFGDAAEPIHHEAADCFILGAFLNLESGDEGVDFVGAAQAREDPVAVAVAQGALGASAVVFVGDFADDFFYEIFERCDARGSAVFVEDHGEL